MVYGLGISWVARPVAQRAYAATRSRKDEAFSY